MPDILNCPCCGGKARFMDTVNPFERLIKCLIRIGRIECKGCGVRTGVNTFGRVLKTWNRRVLQRAYMDSKKDGAL